jgi:Arsenical pump membrane protein
VDAARASARADGREPSCPFADARRHDRRHRADLGGDLAARRFRARSRSWSADIRRRSADADRCDVFPRVVPLVAGLFVFVEALDRTGLLGFLSDQLRRGAQDAPALTAWASAFVAGFGSNIANNLPVGLLAGAAIQLDSPPPLTTDAILIGVDLGPNLSVTGSLATILWLVALRREGEHVSALEFLKVGALIMPVSLVLAVAALFIGR